MEQIFVETKHKHMNIWYRQVNKKMKISSIIENYYTTSSM